MTRPLAVIAGAFVVGALVAITVPGDNGAEVALAAAAGLVVGGIGLAATVPELLRARREHREAQARVMGRIDELRALRPTDELDRAADPTPGTVRRARQARGKRTPRARKHRTGRWG